MKHHITKYPAEASEYLFYLSVSVFIVFITLLPVSKIADFDLFFHLRLGEHLWETYSLYRLDEFSYTYSGSLQYTGEWLSNALFFGIFKYSGFYGLGILKIALFLTVILFTYRSLRLLDAKDYIPLMLSLIVMAYSIRFRLDLRPYYFTYICLSVFLYTFLRYRKTGKGLYILPFVQVFWSNTHGGWILGPLFTGLFLLTETVRQRRLPLPVALLMVLTVAASALNPEGMSQYRQLLDFQPFGRSGASEIGEWQSMTGHLLWGFGMRYTLGFQILFMGALLYLISEAVRKRFDLLYISVFAASAVYAFKHVRLIAVATVLLTPLFYLGLKLLFKPLKHRFRAPLYILFTACVLYLTVFSVIKSNAYSFGFGPKERVLFDAALRFLDENNIRGNGFNSITVGSYMLWRSPHRKVFIDGRLVSAPEVHAAYKAAIKDKEGFEKLVEKYNVNHALIDYNPHNRWRFPFHLNTNPDWPVVFWDNSSVVYLKRSPENMHIIAEREFKLLRPGYNNFAYLDRYLSTGHGPADGRAILKLIDEDIKKSPGTQELHLAKAYICYYYGLKDIALKELQISLNMQPDTAFEHISIAQLLLEMGDRESAEKELRHALRLEPYNKQAKTLLYGELKY